MGTKYVVSISIVNLLVLCRVQRQKSLSVTRKKIGASCIGTQSNVDNLQIECVCSGKHYAPLTGLSRIGCAGKLIFPFYSVAISEVGKR